MNRFGGHEQGAYLNSALHLSVTTDCLYVPLLPPAPPLLVRPGVTSRARRPTRPVGKPGAPMTSRALSRPLTSLLVIAAAAATLAGTSGPAQASADRIRLGSASDVSRPSWS